MLCLPLTHPTLVHREGIGRVGVEFSFLLTLGWYIEVGSGFILALRFSLHLLFLKTDTALLDSGLPCDTGLSIHNILSLGAGPSCSTTVVKRQMPPLT